MDDDTMTKTRPASAWTAVSPCGRLRAHGTRLLAPTSGAHRTGLSAAEMPEQVIGASFGYAGGPGTSAQAAFAGVRSTDLPGSPPRGAPV